MTERDERALREALQGLEPDEPVDLGLVRRRAGERRRHGRTAVGVLVALVLLAGVVGLPRLLPPGATSAGVSAESDGGAQAGAAQSGSEPDARAGDAPATPDPAPPGWRTEYYRDISFTVPATWGYGVPPQSDWCADGPAGQPRADQRRPYVWLGSDVPVRSIGCPPRPATLLTEHVEALSPGPAVEHVEGAVREGDWWRLTRFAGSAVLVVTTSDRVLGDQILDSAQVEPAGAPCRPTSSVAEPLGTRPDDGTALASLPPVEQVVLCQYEPAPDPAEVELPSLRAAVTLDRAAGQALVDELAAAPVNHGACRPAPVEPRPDLAVLVRIRAGGAAYDVFVNPAGCPGGAGMAGGIDDGTSIRTLTRPACSALLAPPVALWSAGGDVGRNCLR